LSGPPIHPALSAFFGYDELDTHIWATEQQLLALGLQLDDLLRAPPACA